MITIGVEARPCWSDGSALASAPAGAGEGALAPLRLNTTSRRIADLIDGRRSVGDISAVLAGQLACHALELLSEVRAVLTALCEAGAVVVGAHPLARHAIDWQRLAEPQGDQYDSEAILDLVAERERVQGVTPRAPWRDKAGTIRLGEGRVAVSHCYRNYLASVPSPDTEPAPLDHPNIPAAEAFLNTWPEAAEQLGRLMRCLHPLQMRNLGMDGSAAFLGGSQSHSVEDLPLFGTLYSTINCPLMLADNLVHEMAHQKLFAMGVYKESADHLITNAPGDLYVSPVITSRPRPMSAVVHGVYAFCHVVQLELKILEADILSSSRSAALGARLIRSMGRLQAGQREIRAHARTDSDGGTFVSAMDAWIERMLQAGRERFGLQAFPEPAITHRLRPAVAA